MSTLPSKAKVVIIGGGIHGLSTAWKLSETYKNPNDIVVIEKEDTASSMLNSGASLEVISKPKICIAMRDYVFLDVCGMCPR